MSVTSDIPDKFVLPCDFIVGTTIFRKGVRLETIRGAAEAWLRNSDPSEVCSRLRFILQSIPTIVGEPSLHTFDRAVETLLNEN